MLLPLIYKPKSEIKYKYGFIPHYLDAEHDFIKNIDDKSLLIDICSGDRPLQIIDEISTCDIIVSSSLHGLVLAVAYGKPCIWVQFSDRITGGSFKFRDFFSVFGLEAKSSCLRHAKDMNDFEKLEHRVMSVPLKDVVTCQKMLLDSSPFG